ncbi:MAG: AAA family ATPase [Lachnospiraceae bacterium]|nr:AAA family ATPase [Lachnospiraceae bacterium]
MQLEELSLFGYKIFDGQRFVMNGKSTVIFGVNGTGKSTVLSAINYVNRVWINRLNPVQGKAFSNFSDDMITVGEKELMLHAIIRMEGKDFRLTRFYQKAKKNRRTNVPSYHSAEYANFTEYFREAFLQDENENIPIFVNYGTNRSVLDIPDRIRKTHEFDKLSALERVIENELDFRTFFEWYRDQEANEIIEAREQEKIDYNDPILICVRHAIEAMLGNVSNLRIRRNPVRMVVDKSGREIRVDLLSDGEKCTLAMFGDLARRLALANPALENPLEGKGIVLIDEIELHMHPVWQRKVLRVLREVFPNIQFIITTHSPQILGEADDRYNIFVLSETENARCEVGRIERMDGYDSNMILEKYMGTDSKNGAVKELISEINRLILHKKYLDAEALLGKLAEISGVMDEEYIMASGFLKRSKILDEKNKQAK